MACHARLGRVALAAHERQEFLACHSVPHEVRHAEHVRAAHELDQFGVGHEALLQRDRERLDASRRVGMVSI